MPENADLGKVLRTFRLVQLLNSKPYYTAEQLGDRLEVSARTIRRDVKLLERLGFLIDKDPVTHRYFLHVEAGDDERIDAAEAEYLNDALQQLPDDNALRNALMLKLNKQFRLLPVVQTLQRNAHFLKLRDLQRAVETGRVVEIYNYLGGNGKVSAKRRVAITGFTENNRRIHAWDLDLDAPRQFTLDRMGAVRVTEEATPAEYPFYPNDLFGWPGKEWFNVRLQLSERAAQLLREEYPAAVGYLTPRRDGGATADLRVRGFESVGRWVLGLPSEVEVLEGGDGVAFRGYLRGKAREW